MMNDIRLPQTLGAFLHLFVKKQKGWFIAMIILAFAWSIDNTVWPYVFRVLIDKMGTINVQHDKVWHLLTPLLIFWVITWLAIDLAFRLNTFIFAWVFPKFEAQIRMALFDYVMQHSYGYFINQFAGNLSNRISDMTQSAARIMQMLIRLFLPVLLAIIIATTIFFRISPYFSLLLCCWAAIHMGICLFGARPCARLSKEHADARSFLTGKIVDTLTNIITVKLFARRTNEQQHVNSYQQEEQSKSCRALLMVAKIEIFLSISSFIFPNVLLTWYLIYCWQHGYISVGSVVLIITTTWNIQHLVWFAGSELPNLYKEIGVCQQALSLVKVQHGIQDASNALPLIANSGSISFDQVNFAYDRQRPVFQDLTVKIEGGSKVGLVGFSGSGKSTFVNLIFRFFEVTSGQISIDGKPINAVTLDSLRSQIAMIPQDPTLFHRSLRENIAYGKVGASDEEIVAAAQQAHCHHFITELPQGYDTLVGERGIKLSGGQRQRIAIARAVLEDTPILVLDEATSALDSVTEKQVQAALYALMQRRTTIVIAHRLSTLAQMDRILVFNKGEIIEDGSHQELLKAQGHYAKMWAMQSQGFLPERLEED